MLENGNCRLEKKEKFNMELTVLIWFILVTGMIISSELIVREPGGEYVKNITIKNVVMKTQKIKYQLPQTRYFSMEFPETQTLSAGMKWTVPVTFRPVAKVIESHI
jgi:hypothetical protein